MHINTCMRTCIHRVKPSGVFPSPLLASHLPLCLDEDTPRQTRDSFLGERENTTYACMYLCVYVCMCLCMHVSMYVCVYVHMYVCITTVFIEASRKHTYICMYVSILWLYESSRKPQWAPEPQTSSVYMRRVFIRGLELCLYGSSRETPWAPEPQTSSVYMRRVFI